METFTCAQRGCTFEAKKLPDDCPVCNNPMVGNGKTFDEPWDLYGVKELRQTAKDWGLEGYSGMSKAELIELLKAADDD